MSGRPGIYGHPNNPQSNSHPHPATKSTLPLECELLHLGLVCYLQNLVDAGFDTWEAVQDINEWDMYDPSSPPHLVNHLLMIEQGDSMYEIRTQKSLFPHVFRMMDFNSRKTELIVL